MSRRRRSNITVLGWTAFFSGMAQEMVYPLLPLFVVVALSGSATTLGVIEGMLAAGVTIARYASGRAIDGGRITPLRMARVSYGVSLVSRPMLAIAPNVGAVVVLRAADGLGKGGKDAPKDALVAADAHERAAGRAFGIQTLLDTLGSVVGPLLAGLVVLLVGRDEAGLRIAFGLAAIPGVCAMLMLRRAHDAPRLPRVARHDREPLPRSFYVLLAAVTVFGLANSSDTLLLLRAQGVGLDASQVAFAFAAFNLAYALLAIPAGALSDRIGRRRMLAGAWLIYIAVYVGFALADSATSIVLLLLLYGGFYAAADGTIKAWVVQLVPADRRAHAFGLIAAAGGLLVLPAGIIAGVLWDRVSPDAAFLAGAAVAAVATGLLAFVPAPRLHEATSAP